MKYLSILVLFILVAGCSEPPKTTQRSSEPTKEWLIFEGKANMPKVVLVSGDEEYRSEEALPQLAKILSTHHGFNCTVLFAQDPAHPGIIDPNYKHNIPGLDQLASADLMVIFTRFRALPDDQMKHIDDYLKSGKPVLGIRTATHAFSFEDIDFESGYKHYSNYHKEEGAWADGFGRLILGEKWISHHGEHGGQSTKGFIAPGAAGHPILNGIQDGDVWGPTDVYGIRLPLSGDAQPIVLGQVTNREGEFDENDPLLGMRPTDRQVPEKVIEKDDNGNEFEVDLNDPMMPIAWTKSYQIPGGEKGKSFASTIGASTDLLAEGTRRIMVNAVFWLTDKEVPTKAKVNLVGMYKPTRFAFHKDEYWDKRSVAISSLE